MASVLCTVASFHRNSAACLKECPDKYPSLPQCSSSAAGVWVLQTSETVRSRLQQDTTGKLTETPPHGIEVFNTRLCLDGLVDRGRCISLLFHDDAKEEDASSVAVASDDVMQSGSLTDMALSAKEMLAMATDWKAVAVLCLTTVIAVGGMLWWHHPRQRETRLSDWPRTLPMFLRALTGMATKPKRLDPSITELPRLRVHVLSSCAFCRSVL